MTQPAPQSVDMPMENPIQFLKSLFQAAVDRAQPELCLPDFLTQAVPNPEQYDRIFVGGAGKASGAMAKAIEAAWPEQKIDGVVVTQHGYAKPCEKIDVIEAAHPVPDDTGFQVASQILEAVEPLGEKDLAIFVISGGGSALMSLPPEGITLAEKKDMNKQLLASGAAISEMNCVRKHVSQVKGGRLAAAAFPAKVLTFLISDVPGDDPSVIASGPTVGDTTTAAQALEVIQKYDLQLAPSILAHLKSDACEPMRPDDKALKSAETHMIATPMTSLQASLEIALEVAPEAVGQDIEVKILSDKLEGNAQELGREHAALALKARATGTPSLILSGGETTVQVTGNGRGGRNTEYLLSFAHALAGTMEDVSSIYALAADTDGRDGSQHNAGAWMTSETIAAGGGLQAAADHLANNDAYSFFEAAGTILNTGPTYTNVNDFRAILIL